jgi:hypothetical protein
MGMAQIQDFEVSPNTLIVPVHGHISPCVHVHIVSITMDYHGPGPRVTVSILNTREVKKKNIFSLYFSYFSY